MRAFTLFGLLVFCFSISFAQDRGTPLSAGDTAPNFTGLDQNGTEIDSRKLVQEGQTVLIFYRGAWCPVCKRHLSSLQDSLQLLLDKGVSVIAVSPETSESAEKIISKTGATFSVIQDPGYRIMKAFGVDFTVNKANVPNYYAFTLNKSRMANGNEDDQLPVPATFIIEKGGKIKWRHYDFDYHNRASVRDILREL